MLNNKLRSWDELSQIMNQKDNVQYLHPEELVPYHKHKFRGYEGKRFDDMVESVKAFGIIQPVIAREYNGMKEILVGHNRTRAAASLDILVPTIIIEVDDELADSIVRESNIYQRGFDSLKLSEQSEILRDHFEQLKKTGKKAFFVKSVEDGEIGSTRDMIAKDYGLSGRSISRKLRINYLIPEFREAVDGGKLSLNAAVDLSYISDQNQEEVYKYFLSGKKINGSVAKRLRKNSEAGALDEEIIESILCGEKKETIDVNNLSKEELKNFLMEYPTNLPVWFDDKRTGEHYRKWDVSSNLSIVVRSFIINADEPECAEWFLVQPDCTFRHGKTTIDEIVNLLKNDK